MHNALPRPGHRSLACQLLLALVLLSAQGFAQAHVYSHLKSGRLDFGSTSSQVCGECLSSAPLLGGAATPHSPHITLAAVVCLPQAMAAVPRVHASPVYAFRSRAPPGLL